MSLVLSLSSIDSETSTLIQKTCIAKPNKSQYNDDPDPVICFAVNEEEDLVYIPLGLWNVFIDEFPNFEYPRSKMKCLKKLYTTQTDPKKYRDQDIVFEQILEKLERDHCVFISAGTGFGKCLDPDTLVLLFNGDKKKAKDIKCGDWIMGDDSTHREVVSLITGEEEMYEVYLDEENNEETYKVNESHILTLKVIPYLEKVDIGQKLWFYYKDKIQSTIFQAKMESIISEYRKRHTFIIDLPLKKFLELENLYGDIVHHIFYACKSQVEYPERQINFSRKRWRETPFPDKIRINSVRQRINVLERIVEDIKMGWKPIEEKQLEILELAKSTGNDFIYDEETFPYPTLYQPTEEPVYIRKVGFGKYNGFQLRGENKRFVLGNYHVTHNTTLGNYSACHVGLKTAILCHLDTVNNQWVDEFSKHSTAKVQRIKGNVRLDPNADVYVMSIRKPLKRDRTELSNIGLVIYDEAHIATITTCSKTLLRFQPKYIIGLSATPKRADGMQKLLAMYFGPVKEFIVRREVKNFTVYKVETPYKPVVKYTMVKGVFVPNWTEIVNSIAYCDKRQNDIVNIILQNPTHRILVLSDRQEQCKSIFNKLQRIKEFNGGCKLIIGTGKPSQEKARVLIAGAKKIGAGFDDPSLTLLIIASDCKNVEQWEGRIRTDNNIIYDFVDYYKTFENHWKIREKWYLQKGAVVEVISMRNVNVVVPEQRLLKPNN
jgi:hypothetical protein